MRVTEETKTLLEEKVKRNEESHKMKETEVSLSCMRLPVALGHVTVM